MKTQYFTTLILPFIFIGCSSLTDVGSKVSISYTVWQGCQFVSALNTSETDSRSDFALRNQAGKLGANLVVVTGYANHGLINGQIPFRGDAYKCVTAAEKKLAEEKARIEAEKKLAEEKARLEAEKAKLEEEKRLTLDKEKIEADKKAIAEEKARLEKLSAEVAAQLELLATQAAANAVETETKAKEEKSSEEVNVVEEQKKIQEMTREPAKLKQETSKATGSTEDDHLQKID